MHLSQFRTAQFKSSNATSAIRITRDMFKIYVFAVTDKKIIFGYQNSRVVTIVPVQAQVAHRPHCLINCHKKKNI